MTGTPCPAHIAQAQQIVRTIGDAEGIFMVQNFTHDIDGTAKTSLSRLKVTNWDPDFDFVMIRHSA